MLPPAIRRMRQHFFPALVLSLLIALTLGCGSGSAHTEPAQTAFPAATVPLTKLSSDPYTNSTSQHATEVEPDTFALAQPSSRRFRSDAFMVAAPPISASRHLPTPVLPGTADFFQALRPFKMAAASAPLATPQWLTT